MRQVLQAVSIMILAFMSLQPPRVGNPGIPRHLLKKHVGEEHGVISQVLALAAAFASGITYKASNGFK